jgi:hypothetical protein
MLALICASCQQPAERITTDDRRASTSEVATAALEDVMVDASCGQCQLGLPGQGCDLAVRIDGEAYFVDGSGIDDHGDAHAHDGLCNAVRRARVSGHVVDGRFQATELELLSQ